MQTFTSLVTITSYIQSLQSHGVFQGSGQLIKMQMVKMSQMSTSSSYFFLIISKTRGTITSEVFCPVS